MSVMKPKIAVWIINAYGFFSIVTVYQHQFFIGQIMVSIFCMASTFFRLF